MSKPVVKVYLLPSEWDEAKLQAFHSALVNAAKTVEDFGIESEEDLITLFPRDQMEKGLGTEILVEVDVPKILDCLDGTLARTIGETVSRFLPKAYVQCKVYRFSSIEGFWSYPAPFSG